MTIFDLIELGQDQIVTRAGYPKPTDEKPPVLKTIEIDLESLITELLKEDEIDHEAFIKYYLADNRIDPTEVYDQDEVNNYSDIEEECDCEHC